MQMAFRRSWYPLPWSYIGAWPKTQQVEGKELIGSGEAPTPAATQCQQSGPVGHWKCEKDREVPIALHGKVQSLPSNCTLKFMMVTQISARFLQVCEMAFGLLFACVEAVLVASTWSSHHGSLPLLNQEINVGILSVVEYFNHADASQQVCSMLIHDDNDTLLSWKRMSLF